MAELSKKTYACTPGLTYINSPGGVSILQIVAVKREGLQYDKVALTSLNNGVTRQWAYDPFRRRVRFPALIPFNPGEQVFVIYKTIV